MRSIAEIQKKLKTFDTYARTTDSAKALQKKWHSIFGTDLSDLSAKSFVEHYREMRSKTSRNRKQSKKTRRSLRRSRRQRGGVGAPLDYIMTPGSQVSVYGRFPVEVNTDPGSIKDLDVYFQDALTLSCGNTNEYWPKVPADMGSNQVGGRRKGRKTLRRRAQRTGRKQRGGDILNDLGNAFGNAYTGVTGGPAPSLDPVSRPMFATVYPNIFQTTYDTVTGATPNNYPAPPEPEVRTWDYVSKGTSMAIPPQNVSNITADMNKMVTPALYPAKIPMPTASAPTTSGHQGLSAPPSGLMAQINRATGQ